MAAPRRRRGLRAALALGIALALAIVLAVVSSGSSAAGSPLGNTGVGSLLDGGGNGYLDVSGAFSTDGGSISALTAYVTGESQAMQVRGVVYSDQSGQPGSLVATSSTVSVAAGAAGAWISLPLPAPVALDAGSYWLGFWYGAGAGSGGGGFAYTNQNGSEWYAPAGFSSSGSPPSSFPSGASSSSAYSIYADVTPAGTAPANSTPPAITGSEVVGQTLTASQGSWSGSPSGYAYQWQRCDASGANCSDISGAGSATYVLVAADLGSTLQVVVTASNGTGSTPATSAPTGVVAAAALGTPPSAPNSSLGSPAGPTTGSLGTATVGATAGRAGYLDVNGPFTLGADSTASKLVAYLAGGSLAGSIRPVVYRSASGNPGALVAVGPPVSVAPGQNPGWVDLPLDSTVSLTAGGYFIGFWYGGDVVLYQGTKSGVERYAANGYSANGSPSDPFGSSSTGSNLYSLYLPYTQAATQGPVSVPTSTPTTSTPTTTTTTTTTTTATTPASSSGIYEDSREGFPKIAAYRPGCATSGQAAARFDWVVTDGNCASTLDAGYALNHSLLGLIEPATPSGGLFAASYGSYDAVTSPLSDPAIGSIRAFQSSDWLHDSSGGVHNYGSVNVLNWLSSSTALWSADVVAYWAKQNGALNAAHPGIQGVWGDNDFWSDQGYAFTGTAVGSNRATWDTNFVAHHDRLAADLPGMVIGGNDISSYADNPSGYQGSQANGWLLPGVSSAGMRECADRYFGLYTAAGVDSIIADAQTFLAGKAVDGKQRYLMLNNCAADSNQINEYSLAVATIGGMYYWPYTQSGWWTGTLTLAPAIPDVTHNGARNWLGAPTAAPQKLASGLWKRTFEHGTVYANMTGSTQTVDGHTLGNETGLFVSS